MTKSQKDMNQTFMFQSLDDMVSKESEVRFFNVIISEVIRQNRLDYLDRKGKSKTGRPAYSFETMIQIYIYGYINRITSTRRLEAECKRNLELIWLTGWQKPDYGTIAGFRKKHGEEIAIFSKHFKLMLKKIKLIGNEFSIDGTKIKANVNPNSIITLKKLKTDLEYKRNIISEYLTELEIQDKIDSESSAKIDAMKNESVALESIIETLQSEGKTSYSLVDNDSRFMKSRDGLIPAYNAQVAVDDKHGFIVSDTITTDPADSNQLELVVNDIIKELEIDEKILTNADKGYFNFAAIEKLESTGKVDCFVGVAESTSPFRKEFIYDKEKNIVICPEGKTMSYHQLHRYKNGTTARVYQTKECFDCKLKDKCCPKTKHGRSFEIYDNEEFRKAFREKMASKIGKAKMKLRKMMIERVFGTIKTWAGKIPILTRGIKNVGTELKLYCLAYNVKHLITMFTLEEFKALIAQNSLCLRIFRHNKPTLALIGKKSA
jgi:transposase